jgi:hypothetical protein
VRGILEGFFFLDLLKQFFPMRECCFGSNVFLCVPKGRGLDEGLLGNYLNDRHRFGGEF